MTIPPAARRAAEEYIVELIRAVRMGRAAAPRRCVRRVMLELRLDGEVVRGGAHVLEAAGLATVALRRIRLAE